MPRAGRVVPGAKEDIREGFEYYRGHAGIEVARGFRDVILAGIDRVLADPEMWPSFDEDGARRFLVRRFPYGIVYHCDPECVTVLAVMHLRRQPGYWKHRRIV